VVNNGRAAVLALAFLLRRDRVAVDVVDSVLLIPRRADDPEGAFGLARTIASLIATTGRRA
jgi:hypothetical protein